MQSARRVGLKSQNTMLIAVFVWLLVNAFLSRLGIDGQGLQAMRCGG